jgi:hypothetical protein
LRPGGPEREHGDESELFHDQVLFVAGNHMSQGRSDTPASDKEL